MKESDLSRAIRSELAYRGIFSYKTADRFHSGVPDIYVCGGNWIESKVGGATYKLDIHKLLRPEQRNFARNLKMAGDTVWMFIAVEWVDHGRRYWAGDLPLGDYTLNPLVCSVNLEEQILAFCRAIASR